MNKVLFNIIAWPLLLAISFFVAFGIGQQKKLSADNANLSAMLAQIQQENETLKNNSSKQTSGVMTGIFRMYPNGEDVTLPNGTVIESSGDQYYVLEETEMYMFGNKKESTTFQLSLKDNKVIVTQGDAPFMELIPDYDKEWYTVEVNGTTQYFKKTTEREFYLEFLGKGYKEDYEGFKHQNEILRQKITDLEGSKQTSGVMTGYYFANGISEIFKIDNERFSEYILDFSTGKYAQDNSSHGFVLNNNNLIYMDWKFVPDYENCSYKLVNKDTDEVLANLYKIPNEMISDITFEETQN